MGSLTRKFNRFLNKLGLDVKRYSPSKELPLLTDPNESIHQNKCGFQNACVVKASDCRVVNGFSFSNRGWHPLSAVAKEIVEDASLTLTFEHSILYRYYGIWQPKNAREALINVNAPSLLAQLPAYTLHTPILDRTPTQRQKFMEYVIETENLWIGKHALEASAGYGLQGPVAKLKGEIEFQRMKNTALSINAKGYLRTTPDGDITATAIKVADQFLFVINHGQHRAAALSGLGFEEYPIHIEKLFDAAEMDHWPQIFQGYWSTDQAKSYISHLRHFDSYAWAKSKGLIPCE